MQLESESSIRDKAQRQLFRFYQFFKLFKGIKILNTKTKNLVYQIIDKTKCRTQNKEQKRVSLLI